MNDINQIKLLIRWVTTISWGLCHPKFFGEMKELIIGKAFKVVLDFLSRMINPFSDEDNPDQDLKKMKMKDRRNKWFKWTTDSKDEMRTAERGNYRRGKFQKHAGVSNVDLRYYDPNILRFGQDWMPEEFHSDSVEAKKEAKESEILFMKGAEALAQEMAIENAPESDLAYLIPSFHEKSAHPQGLPRFDDGLVILGAEQIRFDESTLDGIEIEEFEKIETKVKNIIRHGRVEQVDAGEFGLDQPVFDKFDSRFGSIDKTNQFKGHCDQQSLYDDQWIWDERHGVIKPERSSRVIAKNLSNLLFRLVNPKSVLRLPEQDLVSLFPVIGGQQMCMNDRSTEVWYSTSQPKIIQGDTITRNCDENEVFNPLQLFSTESRIHPDQLTLSKQLDSVNVHTVVIHDHPTMAFEQDELNPDRFSGDRELQRKFLPHLREELDDQESLGRLLYSTYGMLYNQAMNTPDRNPDIPLVANGLCVSDGKKLHLIQVQLLSTDPSHSEKVKVCHIGSFDLYEVGYSSDILFDCVFNSIFRYAINLFGIEMTESKIFDQKNLELY